MKLKETQNDFQLVYFITDWWDGPKTGFADFNDIKHYFERIFDTEKDDWSDSYSLRPVSDEEYILQIESYKLFIEWVNDKDSKRPHPASDLENKRYHEIKHLLEHYEKQLFTIRFVIKNVYIPCFNYCYWVIFIHQRMNMFYTFL